MMRSLMMLAVVLTGMASDWSVREAAASVEGNAYEVTIISSFDTILDDVFQFEAGGAFLTLDGTGTWKEVDLIVLSVWEADFTVNETATSYRGLQFASFVFGTGLDTDGVTSVAFGFQQPE